LHSLPDFKEALQVISDNHLVDLNDPHNSRLVQKILEGHNGFPASWATELEDGVHAWVEAMNSGSDSPGGGGGGGDTEAPQAMFTAPAEGANIQGTLSVQAMASDNVGVVSVQFYLDDMWMGAADTAAPYELNLDTNSLGNGAHTLGVRAADEAGNLSALVTLNINVNNSSSSDPSPSDDESPSVALTAPANGASVSGSITLSASASDNVGVAGVQFYVDGVAKGSEDTSSPYSVSLDTTALSNGSHAVTAKARDAAGNMTTSAARNVTVSNAATNPNATYTWIYNNILNSSNASQRCVTCHVGAYASGNIRYDTYAETVKSVQAGSPNASPLYASTNDGTMPMGGSKLSDVQLKAIRDWITAGAPNN
jgi:hypothetical protein